MYKHDQQISCSTNDNYQNTIDSWYTGIYRYTKQIYGNFCTNHNCKVYNVAV